MSAFIKRTEISQVNNLMQHLKLLEKQEQGKTKTSMREIIKIMAEINEIETNKTKQTNQTNKKPYKGSMKQKAGSLKK
jgi:Asp-tRNA(Asn)/Glu-tRNA(Gln) amidotransferase C subunit